SYRLLEGFSEVSVVPVSGLEYAEWTELDLALRGVNYDSFGSAATWKVGALVKTIGGVALRGTYGTAFRVPSVRELYQGCVDSFPEVVDLCDMDIDGDGASDGPLTDPVAARRCAD